MFDRFRDPFSGLSHLLGAVLIIGIGMPYMLTQLPEERFGTYLAGYLVFSLSMFIMFTASAVYHLVRGHDKTIRMLKRIDHIAIYIMIAGSYTPYLLIGLPDALGWWMFGLVWGIALLGIVKKIYWLHAPRWFSTVLYLIMGWICIFIYSPLSETLNKGAIDWLVAGGICYTLGAVVYATKWPNLAKSFNFHDLWHIFVLGGATCHFISVGIYL